MSRKARRRLEKHRRDQVVRERLVHLHDLMDSGFHPEMHDRYVQHMRNLATKYRIPLPRATRFLFCKGCKGAYSKMDGTLRVRIRNGKVLRTCPACGHVNRHDMSRGQGKAHVPSDEKGTITTPRSTGKRV